jgi:hypothetical protein
VRIRLRTVPWLLAFGGLLIPLVASAFVTWPIAVAWLAILLPVWLFGGKLVPTRAHRIAAALVLLPVLVVLAFEGGWWLIPADLAWLAIEIADRSPVRAT